MNRTLLLALASAAFVPSAVGQLPNAKYPPAKNAPPVKVPKNRKDVPKPAGPPKPVWQEFKLNPKTTLLLDFTESSPDAVLQIFSRTSGITILRDPSFKIPLTVTSAKAVPLNEAFEILNTVLSLNGYTLQKRGNLLVVARPQPQQAPVMMAVPPQPPQPLIKTYPIANASATQVARVLNEILGAASGGGNPGAPQGLPPGIIINGMPAGGGAPGGGGGKFKASSEEYSNSVIVEALPADQAKAKAIIDDLDRKTAKPLESELFTLKYVPAEQAISAIEDVLTANAPVGRGAARPAQNQNYFSFYNPYGGNQSQHTAGGQSATAIKQTNSVIVNATRENMELVRKLLKTLDQQGNYVGTTFFVPLANAKASDVADLLTKLFADKANNNNGGFFFFDDAFGGSNNRNKNQLDTDVDENGQVVSVRDIKGKVTVVADPNTNGLVIQTQPGNMRMIRPIIERLDSPATQVMIETVIVEATLDKTDKLGVEYGTLGSVLNGSDTGAGSIDFGLGASTTLQGLKYTIGNPDYKVFLNAVASDTRFKVLDTPRIFTSNNAKAVIDVGQHVPYLANTEVNTLGNVISNASYLDVDVNLTVTPRITAGGQVTMDVTQSADDLAGYQALAPNISAPLVNKRSASTTVSVEDGATVVLGGIIRHTSNDSKTKVPILGDLPVLGYLFRSTVRERGQTELLVFLTPHIVRRADDAQKLRRDQTNELSKPTQDDLKRVVPPVKGTKGP